MLQVTADAASSLFNWSNAVLVLGTVLVVIGTWGAIWAGGIKERYAELRTSENEAAAAKANAEAARLRESNTQLELQLERERIERLKLEHKIKPRQLSANQRENLTRMMSESGWAKAEIIWHGHGEPELFARDLGAAFEQAGLAVQIHTLGPFIPAGWGLCVIETENDVGRRLKRMLDQVGVESDLAETNDTIGKKDHPTLFVGMREDMDT